MNDFEDRIRKFITVNSIQADHRHFEQSCHSVSEAAEAAGADPRMFVKNIVMLDSNNKPIVAIVKGEDRASTSRVKKALELQERPRVANPDEILSATTYPVGGVPSFGYEATFLIDPRVMELQEVWTGGGSDHSLIKVGTEELVKANKGRITRVRK